MRLLRRRRAAEQTVSREEAVAAAKGAARQARRDVRKLRRHQEGKQSAPARRMTPNQSIAVGQ